MQRACAAKAHQRKLTRVIALLNADHTQRSEHVLIDDIDNAAGSFHQVDAERIGELVEQRFFYDGESLTLFNPDDAYYATLAAPPGIDAMLDFAHDTLDLVAPGADLLYTDAHARLMAGVESGFVVGDSVIDGVRCT